MGIKALTPDDMAKLKNIVDDGVRIHQEIDDLRGGLRDTVKDLAEEMDIKPKVINDAIRIAFKDSLNDVKDHTNDVETVLDAVGRGDNP